MFGYSGVVELRPSLFHPVLRLEHSPERAGVWAVSLVDAAKAAVLILCECTHRLARPASHATRKNNVNAREGRRTKEERVN